MSGLTRLEGELPCLQSVLLDVHQFEELPEAGVMLRTSSVTDAEVVFSYLSPPSFSRRPKISSTLASTGGSSDEISEWHMLCEVFILLRLVSK